MCCLQGLVAGPKRAMLRVNHGLQPEPCGGCMAVAAKLRSCMSRCRGRAGSCSRSCLLDAVHSTCSLGLLADIGAVLPPPHLPQATAACTPAAAPALWPRRRASSRWGGPRGVGLLWAVVPHAWVHHACVCTPRSMPLALSTAVTCISAVPVLSHAANSHAANATLPTVPQKYGAKPAQAAFVTAPMTAPPPQAMV